MHRDEVSYLRLPYCSMNSLLTFSTILAILFLGSHDFTLKNLASFANKYNIVFRDV